METRRQTPDGNGDGNGDEDNGNRNEDRIEEGGREVKKHRKPQNNCRRLVGNEGDLVRKREKNRKERVGPVAANPDNLESNKEAEGGAQGTQGSSKNSISRESVSPLSLLIRGFVPLIPPWEDQCEWNRMTRVIGPVCAVMCNLINTHTHTHAHTHKY